MLSEATTPAQNVAASARKKRPQGLTAILKAKPESKPYKVYDRDRLYVLVNPNGTKRWAWAYRLADADGVEKDYTYSIGRFPDVSIEEARDAKDEAAQWVELGKHPAEVKQQRIHREKVKQANTFWLIADDWIVFNETTVGKWSATYQKQVRTNMARYIRDGLIGDMAIHEIKAADFAALLRGVAKGEINTGNERTRQGRPPGSATIAKLLCMWCECVYAYAMQTGVIERNLIADAKMSKLIQRPAIKNNRALTKKELELLFARLAGYRGSRVTVIMVELLALFFVRTGELRLAQWSEFNFEERVWTVPAQRMKMKRAGDHVVSLSDQAIVLLRELKKLSGKALKGPDYLFKNTRRPSEPMTATTVNRCLQNIGFNGVDTIGFSAHGFRGTASTLLHEMGFEPEHIETQLAHKQGSAVSAIYNKAAYRKKRRKMMQSWANYLDKRKAAASMLTIQPDAEPRIDTNIELAN